MLVSVHQEILLISLIDFQSNTNLFLKFLLSNFEFFFFNRLLVFLCTRLLNSTTPCLCSSAKPENTETDCLEY